MCTKCPLSWTVVVIALQRHSAPIRAGIALLVALALLAPASVAMATDDYPYSGQTGVDPWGFYKGYCTSFVAYRMNRNAGPMSFYNYMDGGHFGNAGNWAANAQKLGIPVNSTPAVGAIAWWGYDTVSDLGHVGYVEAVNTDGTIVIEDYNYSVSRGYSRRIVSLSDTRVRPTGYIHFRDVPPPPPPDTTVPVITFSCVRDGGVYASAITPGYLVADNALKSVTATMDGAPFVSGAIVSAPGEHTLTVTATDAAGNTATSAVSFTIDPAAADPDVAFTTIAGPDRYETAVRMSQTAFADATCVIIATGENWPDALGGAALAGVRSAPILLTRKDSLPPVVLEEIRRLGATSAVILGGTGAVGPAVEGTLKGLLGDAVERIGGDDRYATAELIAREVVSASGDAYDGTCLVATGTDFPDALAASPLGAATRWPLVLTGSLAHSGVPTATLDAIGATKAVVLGGTAAVPESVEASLVAQLGEGTVTRLCGADRYATAATIAEFAVERGLRWDGAAIATGQDFPDALAGGVCQGHLGAVMLLTRTAVPTTEAIDPLVANRASIRSLRYLGGEGAVCTGVKLAVSRALE